MLVRGCWYTSCPVVCTSKSRSRTRVRGRYIIFIYFWLLILIIREISIYIYILLNALGNRFLYIYLIYLYEYLNNNVFIKRISSYKGKFHILFSLYIYLYLSIYPDIVFSLYPYTCYNPDHLHKLLEIRTRIIKRKYIYSNIVCVKCHLCLVIGIDIISFYL